MDLAMVVVAEQDQVVELGLTALGPVEEVMGIAPAGRPVAAGPAATSVAGDQGSLHRGRDLGRGTADVDHGGVGAQTRTRLQSQATPRSG